MAWIAFITVSVIIAYVLIVVTDNIKCMDWRLHEDFNELRKRTTRFESRLDDLLEKLEKLERNAS